jgi:hypothetical protein
MSYPEHEKETLLAPAALVISEFLDWLGGQGIELAKWDGEYLPPLNEPNPRIINRFLQIDEKRLEQERKEMLAAQRAESINNGHDEQGPPISNRSN